MSGKAIDPGVRKEIKEKVREGIVARKVIAEQFGISLPTVHNIAKEIRRETSDSNPSIIAVSSKSKSSAKDVLQDEINAAKKELDSLSNAVLQIEKLKEQISRKEQALILLQEENKNA